MPRPELDRNSEERGQEKPRQATAPLVEALTAYAQRVPISFHVPGHKRGTSFRRDPQADSWLGAIGPYDATELPGLDDLHAPEGAIREAQQLASELFGAEKTYFLVGGSTVGNLAMLHAVCEPGELVLMQRNVHKSAIHGLMLARARAVMMAPAAEAAAGLYSGVTAETVERALKAYPEAKAVYITNPNYYGMATDVKSIADAAHAYGKPLLVDEAHGAHFGLYDGLPVSALSCGADAVVQSTHKMLSALTMGAMLHVQGERFDRRRLERRLHMLQSSSPSYPILASLDWARKEAYAAAKAGGFRDCLAAAERVREAMGTGRMRLAAIQGPLEQGRQDPLKLLLYDTVGVWSGFRIGELLRERRCDIEMATERYALCAFGIGSTLVHAERLLEAIAEITERYPAIKQENCEKIANIKQLWTTLLSEPISFAPDDGGRAEEGREDSFSLPLQQAIGAYSAESVIPYPPGIPLLLPGERISDAVVGQLTELRAAGASFQGTEDPTLAELRVWRMKEG